jgi:hypothetical protein
MLVILSIAGIAPRRGDFSRGLALFPIFAQPAAGRGNARRSRHWRHPRKRSPLGGEIRPPIRQRPNFTRKNMRRFWACSGKRGG